MYVNLALPVHCTVEIVMYIDMYIPDLQFVETDHCVMVILAIMCMCDCHILFLGLLITEN